MNEQALRLADGLAADAEAAGVEVSTLSNGTRVIDCAAGGFEAGRAFAEICMAGLGSVAYAPLVIEGRYARWCGDGLELRRGEILILEPS